MQILIDITEVAGPKLADLRNIGLVPDAIDGGRDLHVSNPSGSRIVVRDYSTDEVIVSGNGWSNAMQALADHYGIPVKVSRDYGVTGGKSGKVLGFWAPATPADASAAPAPALPKLNKTQAHRLRQLAEFPGLTSYRPGRDYPSYERTRYSYSQFDMATRRDVRCTPSMDHLVELGLAAVPLPETSCRVVLTTAGRAWLTAHPA